MLCTIIKFFTAEIFSSIYHWDNSYLNILIWISKSKYQEKLSYVYVIIRAIVDQCYLVFSFLGNPL